LVASGRSTSAIFSATTTVEAASGATTFTIGAPTAGSDWFGNATRPADNMLVQVSNNFYPIQSAVPNGSGWDVTIIRPDTNDRTQNLGLNGIVALGSSAFFYLRSMIASSGHTMEYVGAGTDYRALPYNATGTYTVGSGTQPNGVPIEAHQVKELDNGKVWAAITDHNGKFRVGDTFSVNQQTGFVSIPAGALSVSTLLEDLDVNGKEIKTDTTNQDIVLNPNGTGVVNVSTSKITNVVDPTDAQDAATKNFVDNLTTSSTTELNILDGATLNTSELNILDGATLDTTELNQLDGASLTDNPTWTSTTQFPSAASINTRFLGLLNALGGFVAIADENSFPNDNPDPSDGAGTVVSIADAGGMSVNASGEGTGQTLGGSTVTITGFPASFNSSTLPAQQGLQVQTTTTLNTYTYHKVIARDDDIVRLNDDVNDFFQRYRFGASNPTTDNDAGDLFFNTGSGTMLVWDTSGATNEWKEVQSIGEFFVIPTSEFPTWNGTINDITITNAPTNASQIILSINGVVQEPNTGTARPTDGFALDGSIIRLSDAPATGSEAWGVIIGSTVNIGAPSANTVSTDKIVDGAVIRAKLGSDAVDGTKIADDSIDSEHYVDGSIDNVHVSSSAAIAGTKISPDFGAQDLVVDTDTLFVDASTNRVGIGTTSPSRNLTVSNGTNAIIAVQNSGQSTEGVFNAPSGGTINLGTIGSTDLTLSTNSIPRATIDSSGRLGLGTSSPGNTLHVNSGNIGLGKYSDQAAATRFIGITGTSGFENVFAAGVGITTTVANESQDVFLQSHNYGVGYNKLVLKADGKVGIGTESPSSLLHVQDAGVTTLIVANTSNSSGLELSGSSTTGEASIGARFNNSQLLFRTAGASGGNVERLRIASTGALGLSGANYGTSGQVLTSQGSGSAPQWANAAGWTEVTATSTSGTDLEFTSLPSDWSELLIIWQGVTGNASHELEFQFGTSATYFNSGYKTIETQIATNTASCVTTTTTAIRFGGGNWDNKTVSGHARIYNPTGTVYQMEGEAWSADKVSVQATRGWRDIGGTLAKVRFYVDTGNFTGGNWKLMYI
jgi:hypothetical protein